MQRRVKSDLMIAVHRHQVAGKEKPRHPIPSVQSLDLGSGPSGDYCQWGTQVAAGAS